MTFETLGIVIGFIGILMMILKLNTDVNQRLDDILAELKKR